MHFKTFITGTDLFSGSRTWQTTSLIRPYHECRGSSDGRTFHTIKHSTEKVQVTVGLRLYERIEPRSFPLPLSVWGEGDVL